MDFWNSVFLSPSLFQCRWQQLLIGGEVIKSQSVTQNGGWRVFRISSRFRWFGWNKPPFFSSCPKRSSWATSSIQMTKVVKKRHFYLRKYFLFFENRSKKVIKPLFQFLKRQKKLLMVVMMTLDFIRVTYLTLKAMISTRYPV